jgi:hypothetical protein
MQRFTRPAATPGLLTVLPPRVPKLHKAIRDGTQADEEACVIDAAVRVALLGRCDAPRSLNQSCVE